MPTDNPDVGPLIDVATQAAAIVAGGGGDELVILTSGCPTMPGEQADDDVRADAAINVLRYLVATYDATRDDTDR